MGLGCGLNWTHGLMLNSGSSFKAVPTSRAYSSKRQWASRAMEGGGERGVASVSEHVETVFHSMQKNSYTLVLFWLTLRAMLNLISQEHSELKKTAPSTWAHALKTRQSVLVKLAAL